MVGEPYLDMSEDGRGLYLASSGFWYGDSGMKLRSLVFLCSELIQQLLSPFVEPEWC